MIFLNMKRFMGAFISDEFFSHSNAYLKVMNEFVTTRVAKKRLGVSEEALRNWADDGSVHSIRTPGGQRLYAITKFIQDRGHSSAEGQKEEGQKICYCRVSSQGQKDDLERQVQYMQERYPEHRIVTDIGSGINFKRKGFRTILGLANRGAVTEVVVAYRDRMCRFAFELVEWILHQNGVKFVVLNQKLDSSGNSELAEDLLSIINVFNCRVNGKRKYRKKGQDKQGPAEPEADGEPVPQCEADVKTAGQLRQWFGCVRSTYNWALGCIKDKPAEYRRWCSDEIWLRKRFVNECNIPVSRKYLLDAPKHVRDTAIVDLAEAYKTNFKKLKKDPSHRFDIRFRSRKADAQSITIPHDAIKEWNTTDGGLKMYPSYLTSRIKFYLRGTDLGKIDFDCRLTLDRLGRFYLCIPDHASARENQAGDKRHEWCSVDPGVRTKMTVYSPTPGVCYKLADGDIQRLFRLCRCLDGLISKTGGGRCKAKRRMRLAQVRLRLRIKHLVNEVHWKSIRFLLDNFKNIIIPPFNVSQMVKRASRKIRSKTVRQMLCWRHFAFRTRLIAAAQRVPGASVHVRSEEWTSKTCTHCGNVKHDLGGAKSYRCPHCHLMADRDVTGSRNIFIKNASIRKC